MGRACISFPLNSHLCDQLLGYAMIEKDLRTSIIWAKKIQELSAPDSNGAGYKDSSELANREVLKALFVASLSFYGKCFTVGKGRPVKLEKAIVPKELVYVHESALLYRHNYASHGGDVGIEKARAVLVRQKNIKPGKQFGYGVMVELLQPDVMWFEDGEKNIWLELFEGVRVNVFTKIESLRNKIAKEEVENDPVKYFGGRLI